jgi:acyl carrier protein
MSDTIRKLIAKNCNLPVNIAALPDIADLYAAGLSSFASVQLMLALEQHFDVTFPPYLQKRKTFGSIASIESALDEILRARKAA